MWDGPAAPPPPATALWGAVRWQPGTTAVRIDGPWTTFLWGGLDNESLAERLNAWRAWALSGAATAGVPPPSLEPAPGELAPRWAMVEIGLGLPVCLVASGFLAPSASDAMPDVVGGLLSFALCGLLVAVPVAVGVGPARIRKHALAWQLGWIAFVLAAAWLGHAAADLLRGAHQDLG